MNNEVKAMYEQAKKHAETSTSVTGAFMEGWSAALDYHGMFDEPRNGIGVRSHACGEDASNYTKEDN